MRVVGSSSGSSTHGEVRVVGVPDGAMFMDWPSYSGRVLVGS